jgi:predicted DCC family thiol-disulfide oxidoreductase YuxK
MILVYDGSCRFCRCCAALVLAADRAGRIAPVTLGEGEGGGLSAGMAPEDWRASWHVVDDAGRLRSGGAAIGPLLRALPHLGPLGALADRVPRAGERAYGVVSARRAALGRRLPDAWVRRADRLIAARRAPRPRAAGPRPATPRPAGGPGGSASGAVRPCPTDHAPSGPGREPPGSGAA